MPRPENESARWLATGARFKPANASTALKDDRTPASAQVDDDLLQFNAALAQLGAQPDELDARPFGNGSLFRDGTPERHREVEEMFAPANAAFAELREIQLKKPWVKISIYAMAGGAEGLRAKIEATRKQREAVTSASSPEGNNSQPPPVAQRSGAKPLAKKPPVIDADEIRRALMLVRQEGAVFEIRALNAQLKGDRFNGTLFGYFSSVDRCIEELGRIHAATGIYITLNPVNRALLARANNRLKFARKDDRATNDTDIESRRWLLIDVDAVRPAGVSATDEEKEAAFAKGGLILAFLRERGWGEPGVVADSGNGMHLLYRVDLPCDDGKLIERVLYSLAQRFDGDGAKLDRAVHNASRIVRLHGTLAAKGDHIDERPHRLSKQLSTSAEKITPELIDALVKELTPRPKIELPSRKKASQQAQTNEKPSRELIREMLAAIPGRPGHADWTNYIAAVADALPDSEAIAVLKERWPEEKEGEYEIALKHRKKEIHIGTLIHAAQQHGYKFPKKVARSKIPTSGSADSVAPEKNRTTSVAPRAGSGSRRNTTCCSRSRRSDVASGFGNTRRPVRPKNQEVSTMFGRNSRTRKLRRGVSFGAVARTDELL